jgi:hypothetical protein
LSKKNNGYKYLLVVVDVLNMRVFAQPLKSKGLKDVQDGFDVIFDKYMPKTPSRLFTDQGKEFESPAMQRYFKDDKNVDKYCSSDKSVKAGIAEK